MAIDAKIVITKRETPPTYPRLMRYIGNDCGEFVVLMTEEGVGTVVAGAPDSHPIGDHFDSWAMEDFERLQGQVILQNQ